MEYSVRLGLVDNLTGSLNKANAGIQQSVSKVSALGKSLAGLGVTLGVGAVLGAVKTLTDALNDQAKADKRVNDNAYSYGTALGYTQEQIDNLYQSTLKYAGASQDKGIFGDEELERMMAQNMQMGVQSDLLSKVGDMTRDLTVRMKGASATEEDLLAANKLINTAIVGGTLPSLKKWGISLDDVSSAQFKAMSQQERATLIMDRFNKAAITGADENARNTMAGHFTAIRKNLGDMLQEIAKWTLPPGLNEGLASIDKLVLTLRNDMQSVTNPIDFLKLEIGGMIEQFKTAFPHVSRLLGLLGTIGAIAGGIYLVVQAFAAVGAVIGVITTAWSIFTGLVIANPIVFALYAVIAVLVLIYTYWDEISAVASACWETITSGCSAFIDYAVSAWDSFCASVTSVFDAIAAKAQWLWANTPLPKIFDIISKGIGWVSDVASSVIGKNATGTNYFAGGLTHVNEVGGEIMNLPNGTQIIPHDISKKMASAGSGNNVTVNVNVAGNVIGNQDFIDQVGDAISGRVSMAIANM